MSYWTQNVIASYVNEQGIEIIIREGLNTKHQWELRLVVPKNLWHLYNDQQYVYDKKVLAGAGTMYLGKQEETGEVRFFWYDGPSHGFGGSKYDLTLTDGSVDTLIGPWSSSASAMNRAGFSPCLEVNIESRYNMASAMTMEAINKLIMPMGYIAVYDAYTYYVVIRRMRNV